MTQHRGRKSKIDSEFERLRRILKSKKNSLAIIFQALPFFAQMFSTCFFNYNHNYICSYSSPSQLICTQELFTLARTPPQAEVSIQPSKVYDEDDDGGVGYDHCDEEKQDDEDYDGGQDEDGDEPTMY